MDLGLSFVLFLISSYEQLVCHLFVFPSVAIFILLVDAQAFSGSPVKHRWVPLICAVLEHTVDY